jgi:hypothetical protein
MAKGYQNENRSPFLGRAFSAKPLFFWFLRLCAHATLRRGFVAALSGPQPFSVLTFAALRLCVRLFFFTHH